MQDFPQAVEKLLKYHRHDIMNILQVISGLAQLQKKDKPFAYPYARQARKYNSSGLSAAAIYGLPS